MSGNGYDLIGQDKSVCSAERLDEHVSAIWAIAAQGFHDEVLADHISTRIQTGPHGLGRRIGSGALEAMPALAAASWELAAASWDMFIEQSGRVASGEEDPPARSRFLGYAGRRVT